jgi:triosephosphate isomerase
MRRPLLAGNWKMNLDQESILALCKTIAKAASALSDRDIGVFPSQTYLGQVVDLLKGTGVAVGGQDLHYEDKGAFTGATSGYMIKDVGATHVLIGHSERRHVFGDTNEDTARKLEAALRHGLIPVFCIGEQLPEREAEKTADVVVAQLKEGLADLSENRLKDLVIAYEPVWAIGTGRTATPEQAGEAHAIVRDWVASAYSSAFAEGVRILYGGSVTPDNVDTLMAVDGVDGTLVGGASLKADSFDRIMRFNP